MDQQVLAQLNDTEDNNRSLWKHRIIENVNFCSSPCQMKQITYNLFCNTETHTQYAVLLKSSTEEYLCQDIYVSLSFSREIRCVPRTAPINSHCNFTEKLNKGTERKMRL